MTVAGCTPAPAVAATIRRLRSRKPRLRLGVRAADGAPGLREVRLLLPNALNAKPKRARRGARAHADGKRLPRRAIELSRDGELTRHAARGHAHAARAGSRRARCA